MDAFFLTLPILVIAVVVIQNAAIFRARDRRLPEETTFSRHEEYCGGVLDYIYWYSKPALRLSLYSEKLVVNGLRNNLSLDYQDIVDVRVTRVLLKEGVAIRHRRQDIATNLVLFCNDNRATARAIKDGMDGL